MGVVIGGFSVAQAPERLNDSVLRLRLPSVNDVVYLGHVAEVWMIFLSLDRRYPAIVLIGIAEKLAVSEVSPEQPELPHVVGDVFAHIADGAVGADDDLLVFLGDFLCPNIDSID